MFDTLTVAQPRSSGRLLDTAPDAFGILRSSADIADDIPALRTRMAADGYLFLPALLDSEQVRTVRHDLLDRLEAAGMLMAGTPAGAAMAASTLREASGTSPSFPDLARENRSLQALLYSGRMMEFYTRFLGGPVRHFDYTWMRAVTPGNGTPPHCDIVYMGRGTTNLYTAWTPLGDVDLAIGGLMILEGSHQNQRLRDGYGRKDADEYCSNRTDLPGDGAGNGRNIGWGGKLSGDPVRLRKGLEGRWLTAEFHMGDLLTFSMYTVHASLDNQSDQIRLSSDSRYQLASEPIDERWIGEKPPGHSQAMKRGKVC